MHVQYLFLFVTSLVAERRERRYNIQTVRGKKGKIELTTKSVLGL